MNSKEYLLTCLIEECGEVIQAATKYLRFGRDSTFTGAYAETNEDHLSQELSDVVAVMELLEEEDVTHVAFDVNRVDAKRIKVKEFRERSRQLGLVLS